MFWYFPAAGVTIRLGVACIYKCAHDPIMGSDTTVVTILLFRSVSLADSRDSIVLTFA
jgi:hypothetical protein